MNVIFLDFDGVLDTGSFDAYLVRSGLPECDDRGRPYFDSVCVENLRRLVETTGADIVVTSDWKYIDTYKDLLDMWKQREMPGFMADITPNVGQHRGDEIARWLEECKSDCNYVILDDLSAENFNSDQFDKLVVDPLYGLDRNALRLAEAILVRQITKSDA